MEMTATVPFCDERSTILHSHKLVKPYYIIVYAAIFSSFSPILLSTFSVLLTNMASFPVNKTLSVELARSDIAKPIKIWLDGAFDMMHYGQFPSLLNFTFLLLSLPVLG